MKRYYVAMFLICSLLTSCTHKGRERPQLAAGQEYAYFELSFWVENDSSTPKIRLSLISRAADRWRLEWLVLPQGNVQVLHSDMDLSDVLSGSLAEQIPMLHRQIEKYYLLTADPDFFFAGVIEHIGRPHWHFRSTDNVELLFDKNTGRLAVVQSDIASLFYLPVCLEDIQRGDLHPDCSSVLLYMLDRESIRRSIAEWSKLITGRSIIGE